MEIGIREYVQYIHQALEKNGLQNINPSCWKVFGTHTFYEGEGGGGGEPIPCDLEIGGLYKLKLWQAIRTIYER